MPQTNFTNLTETVTKKTRPKATKNVLEKRFPTKRHRHHRKLPTRK